MTLHLLGLILISLVFLNGCAQDGFTLQQAQVTSANTSGVIEESFPNDRSDLPEQQDLKVDESVTPPQKVVSPKDSTPPVVQNEKAPTAPPVVEKNPKGEAPTSQKGTVIESGFIKPTIYYHAVIDEDQERCQKAETLTSTSGNVLANICTKTLAVCKMEGSCAIIQSGTQRSFNIASKVKGTYRFFETTKDACKFGFGVKQTCLDPFYSVAADLKLYHTGDVLFVPAIRGVQLPDGSKHTGYFIVRDTGNLITGKGRFDFYSGFLHWTDKRNPFKKLGLADIKTQIPYKIIGGALAVSARNSRAFPKIP